VLGLPSALIVLFLLPAPSTSAAGVNLTIYDDGFSCPAECDAHVVFDSAMNGTNYAHSPNSSLGRFDKCDPNSECRICFDENSKECMNVMYRGGGPHSNTFDFTPAFYEKYCPQSSIPLALADKCKSLNAQATALDGRVNCIRNPDHTKCVDLIKAAKERHAADRPIYEQCKRVGNVRFNTGRPLEQQRSLACAYEKRGTGGPNRKGKTWKRLLPGVCRDNTFVGRDGLDCCNGKPISDGPLNIECSNFYPKP
jgi:hypothetical protein